MQELSKRHLTYDPDLYTDSELQKKIKKTIDLLPGRCREIFLKSRMQGKKNDEIAIELNISKRTVETQISNALKILRLKLKEYTGLLIFILYIPL
jgi:RNA polymerase sigma-70 factor (ECF subfamily)